MTDLNTAWANTQADSNFDEKNEPAAGYVGVVRIADYRTGKSKKGELYFAVDLKDDTQGFSWGVYKAFTKGGQPHEGSIKSAKITLRQLGLDVDSPAQLESALKGIMGRYYTAEVTGSGRINTVTGAEYTNTNITGVASPPAQAAPAPAPSTQVQTPQGVASFPSALPQQAAPAAPSPVDPMMAPAPPVQPSPTVLPTAPAGAAQVMQQNVQAAQAAQVPGQVDPVPFA